MSGREKEPLIPKSKSKGDHGHKNGHFHPDFFHSHKTENQKDPSKSKEKNEHDQQKGHYHGEHFHSHPHEETESKGKCTKEEKKTCQIIEKVDEIRKNEEKIRKHEEKVKMSAEEKIRHKKGMINIFVVFCCVMLSIVLLTAVIICILPIYKRPVLNEPALLTNCAFAIGLMGIFLFFMGDDFQENFEFAIDVQCSANFVLKISIFLFFASLIFIFGVTFFVLPSAISIANHTGTKLYLSADVLDNFHKCGLILLGISFWIFFVVYNKTYDRYLTNQEKIETIITEYFNGKKHEIDTGDTASIEPREIYEYLKNKKKVHTSYNHVRKCVVNMMVNKDKCAECSHTLKQLEVFRKPDCSECVFQLKKLF